MDGKAQAGAAPSLGSAELDGYLKPVLMTAAESPGFFYARIRAARETSDLGIRIRLLSEAIAIYPEWISQSVPGYLRLLRKILGPYRRAFYCSKRRPRRTRINSPCPR